MRNYFYILVWVSASWILSINGQNDTTISELQSAIQDVSKANTQFTSNFYYAIQEKFPGNLMFSGFSISTIMGMLKAGARGITEIEIQDKLLFPKDKKLFSGYNTLLESLKTNDKFTLESAYRIYAQTGFSLNLDFLEIIRKKFGAAVVQLNFGNGDESAKNINSFVENLTRNKIKNLISPGDFDAMTRLVLVNAIYFKGKWKNTFDPKATQKSKFYTTPENSADVQMMRIEAMFPYAEIPDLNATAISLPYLGDRLAMLIFLPSSMDGLKNMETKLKHYDLSQLAEKLTERNVTLQLPRFKVESTIDLKEPLVKIGLKSVFDRIKANFSGIPAEPLSLTINENLYVSKGVQKAFIEVNEEGSEAAAATALRITSRSGLPDEITRFIVNHPFLAFIHDSKNNNLLFTIKITDLRKK